MNGKKQIPEGRNPSKYIDLGKFEQTSPKLSILDRNRKNNAIQFATRVHPRAPAWDLPKFMPARIDVFFVVLGSPMRFFLFQLSFSHFLLRTTEFYIFCHKTIENMENYKNPSKLRRLKKCKKSTGGLID